MPREIERKFLVKSLEYREKAIGVKIKQGYINTEPFCTIRARIFGDKGYITIKGKTLGISRPEYEYEIPYPDAQEIINNFSQGILIEKTRYEFDFEGYTWYIDEFEGKNQGLIVAEIELGNEEEVFATPKFIGEEVSLDQRYSNSHLSLKPFCEW